MSLDIKEAVAKARVYLGDVLQIKTSDVRLEEVELSENGRFWMITLSFPSTRISPIGAIAGLAESREYKVVKLRANTGALVSIKIRSLVPA